MYLYGASGHAKVIIDILRGLDIKIEGLVDDNHERNEFCGVPVMHDANGLSPMIIAIGNCDIRRRIAQSLCCDFGKAIHPSAIISPSATIGAGTVVMAGAVINSEASIGAHCIVNTRASIDHESVIEDFCHIAPGCTISGNVHIGEGTWLGVGSTVIQGVRVGRNCYIGAGSVIVNDIPDNSKAYGVPCKVVKE